MVLGEKQRQHLLEALGIAYNNIQITYRNTSLKSSTKENHVCDLLTDGTENEIERSEMVEMFVLSISDFITTCFALLSFNSKWHF